ncbi:MAG: hypothetical protein PGN13_12650 [Patulibacter minatonensis]
MPPHRAAPQPPAAPPGYVPAPQAYGAPPAPAGAYPPAPQPAAPYPPAAAPQAYGAPPAPYSGQPGPYPGAAPQAPTPYPGAAAAQPGYPQQPDLQAFVAGSPYGAPQGQPFVEQPPAYVPPGMPSTQGTYSPGGYDGPLGPPGLPPRRGARKKPRPSGWNAPAFGLLAIAVVVIGMIVSPQIRARGIERDTRPLVMALSKRDAGARCPRYLTSVLTNVGSVRFDNSGRVADRTDLTGPVCDGLKHLYTPSGKAELSCLTAETGCPESARQSVVAISVVAHESMHLRGQLDEGRAECESIGESVGISQALGIPLDQARMISYLHWLSLNPGTPDRYHVNQGNCEFLADLAKNPPGTPAGRELLVESTADTWYRMAS